MSADTAQLHATACAICGILDQADEVHPARFCLDDLNAAIFSARRLPDRIHYRMVRCRKCGLLRSDPVADPELLAGLYQRSTFDYAAEIPQLRRTYGKYLDRAVQLGAKRGTLLEIGCGNGFLLEEALARGFQNVRGVEPSADAIARASSGMHENIVCDMMRPGLFEAESMDAIAMFQVLDHLPGPRAILSECLRLLRTGGMLLCLNHDAGAWSAKWLGERSPIVDIEHTYLYDQRTIRLLFEKCGFRVREVGSAWNCYTLRYLARLLPVGAGVKKAADRTLQATGIGRLATWAPLGNLYAIAEKP